MTSIWLLAAYAVGVALAPVAAFACGWPALFGSVALCAAWWALRASVWGAAPLLTALTLLGMVHAGQALNPQPGPGHVAHYAGQDDLVLEGEVVDIDPSWDGRIRLDLAARQLFPGDRAAVVSGTVRVRILEGPAAVEIGDVIRLRTRLDRPRNFGTPGEFDLVGHLADQGIYATARLRNADGLVVLGAAGDRARNPIHRWRRQIADTIDRAVVPEDRGLVKALVIGRKSEILPAERRWLSEAGVAHLFAISGLHFGLVGLLCYATASWLYRRSERLILFMPPQRLLPPLLLLPLAVFLVLSGNAIPARRAYLMAAAAALLLCLNRRTSTVHLLAGIALILLVLNPLALFQPAFQLSFSALLGIVFLVPRWQRRLTQCPRRLRGLLLLPLTTFAATLGTLPWTLWHFHQFAPAGLLANLPAIPLIGWGAVPIGLAGALMLPVSAEVAEFLLAGAGALVSLARVVATGITTWPGLQARTCFLTALELSALLLLLVVLFWSSQSRRGHCLRLVLLLCAVTLHIIPLPRNDTLRVTALSVGQGDATLVSLDDRLHYLVDGGGWPGSTADPGERLVAPALGRLGIDRLAGVILTHDHPDHRDGLAHVLRTVPVEHFWSALPVTRLPDALRQEIDDRHIPVTQLPEGWAAIQQQGRFTLHCFVPDQSASDINDRSLLVYAGSETTGALLTADAGQKILSQLENVPGPVGLLKLPHHGSRNAQPGQFLARWAPRQAFLSAGFANRYGHPHQETLDSCRKLRITPWRTDLQGTVQFVETHGEWIGTARHKPHWH